MITTKNVIVPRVKGNIPRQYRANCHPSKNAYPNPATDIVIADMIEPSFSPVAD